MQQTFLLFQRSYFEGQAETAAFLVTQPDYAFWALANYSGEHEIRKHEIVTFRVRLGELALELEFLRCLAVGLTAGCCRRAIRGLERHAVRLKTIMEIGQ